MHFIHWHLLMDQVMHCCARYITPENNFKSSFRLPSFQICSILIINLYLIWLFVGLLLFIFNQNEQTIVYIYNIFMNVGETLPFSPILSAIDCCNQIFLLNKIEREKKEYEKEQQIIIFQ